MKRAFTMVELLVVIAIIALLASILLPALARAKSKAHDVTCINNKRQLAIAAFLYETEHGRFAPSIAPGAGNHWIRGVDPMTWGLEPQNTNDTALATTALFSPYLKGAVDVYRCPADRFVSPEQRAAGWDHRNISVLMNLVFGTEDLTRNGNEVMGMRIYHTSASFVKRSPSDVFYFLDVHPDSINLYWPFFNLTEKSKWPSRSRPHWSTTPAGYHRGGGGIVFADGHAIIRRLQDRDDLPPVTYKFLNQGINGFGKRDWEWFAYHFGERYLDDEDKVGMPR